MRELLFERLLAVRDASVAAKTLNKALPTDGFETAVPGLPAGMQTMTQMTRDGAMAELATSVPMNVIVSNVPGVRETLYIAGARLDEMMPMSIVAHGAGLNITVSSYVDHMEVGLTAATRVVGDVRQLRDDLDASYHEYKAMTEAPLTFPAKTEAQQATEETESRAA